MNQRVANVSPSAALVRTLRRFDKKYAGQYVAYIDKWKRGSGGKRLVRKVLAHSASLKDVNEALTRLSVRERDRVVLHYADVSPPDTLKVHFDLPGRF